MPSRVLRMVGVDKEGGEEKKFVENNFREKKCRLSSCKNGLLARKKNFSLEIFTC